MAHRIDNDNRIEHQISCHVHLAETVQEIKGKAGYGRIRGGEGCYNHQALVDITAMPIDKAEASQSDKFRKCGTDESQGRQRRSWHVVATEFCGHDGGRHSDNKNEREKRKSDSAQAPVKIGASRGYQ